MKSPKNIQSKGNNSHVDLTYSESFQQKMPYVSSVSNSNSDMPYIMATKNRNQG